MTTLALDLSLVQTTFVSSLRAAQAASADRSCLQETYQEKLERLDQGMRLLNDLATAGMEAQIAPLLLTLLQEWAIKEAVELLLRSSGQKVDPTHPAVQQGFWEKLNRQYRVLSAEVLLHLQRGNEQRTQMQETREHSWQSVALKTFERQQELNLHWSQQHQSLWSHAQQENRAWANVAMVSTQQAQLGLQQWYNFASSTQAHVTQMLAGTEQRQAQIVQDAVRKGKRTTWLFWGCASLFVLVSLFVVFGGAFFVLMHLY